MNEFIHVEYSDSSKNSDSLTNIGCHHLWSCKCLSSTLPHNQKRDISDPCEGVEWRKKSL